MSNKKGNAGKPAQTNALATLTANTPIPDVLETLKSEVAQLKKIAETPYKVADSNLEGFGNLTKEKDLKNLIRAASMVIGKERAYDEAAAKLGLKTYPDFEINGGDSEAWLGDIKLRIAVITYEDKYQKLNEFKEKFAKFLSEEDQKTILLKELTGYLSTVSTPDANEEA